MKFQKGNRYLTSKFLANEVLSPVLDSGMFIETFGLDRKWY